ASSSSTSASSSTQPALPVTHSSSSNSNHVKSTAAKSTSNVAAKTRINFATLSPWFVLLVLAGTIGALYWRSQAFRSYIAEIYFVAKLRLKPRL
ncbi:hypothetical protein ACTGZO_11105, partial [Streptococcus suis]